MPDALKVAAFAAIFVLFVPFIEYDTGIRCITTPCASSATGTIAGFLLSQQKYVYGLLAVNLVIGAAVAYLISCIAVRYAFK